jgi:hypothetical protein
MIGPRQERCASWAFFLRDGQSGAWATLADLRDLFGQRTRTSVRVADLTGQFVPDPMRSAARHSRPRSTILHNESAEGKRF